MAQSHDGASKVCVTCGRSFDYRKKWANSWNEVRHCSDRCRKSRAKPSEHETKILELLAARSADKTICPSEVLAPEDKQDKEKMERVRQAARLLAHAGRIEITQGGKRVDPDSFRGPIRLRLTRPSR